MNKIIAISREFGSGGKKIGKRLSDILGFSYYDIQFGKSFTLYCFK